jgi:hypothetical protein
MHSFFRRAFLLIALGLVLLGPAHATTTGITFVYQPLTTVGTDQDSAIIIARIPMIMNLSTPAHLHFISKPNRLVHGPGVEVEESNLLSALNIKVSADYPEDRHYHVVIDLTKMGNVEDCDVTLDQVLTATIQCVEKTCAENKLGTFEIKILPPPGDKTNWSKYEKKYPAPKKKK